MTWKQNQTEKVIRIPILIKREKLDQDFPGKSRQTAAIVDRLSHRQKRNVGMADIELSLVDRAISVN